MNTQLKNSCTFESSINVQSNDKSNIHNQDTPRRSVATLSLGIGVDRASEPGALQFMAISPCIEFSKNLVAARKGENHKSRPATDFSYDERMAQMVGNRLQLMNIERTSNSILKHINKKP